MTRLRYGTRYRFVSHTCCYTTTNLAVGYCLTATFSHTSLNPERAAATAALKSKQASTCTCCAHCPANPFPFVSSTHLDCSHTRHKELSRTPSYWTNLQPNLGPRSSLQSVQHTLSLSSHTSQSAGKLLIMTIRNVSVKQLHTSLAILVVVFCRR